MNKDMIVASILGFGLGLIAAIALWVVPKFLPAKVITVPQTSIEASPKTDTASTLEISTPLEGTISSENQITLKGKADNSDTVVLTTPFENQVLALKNQADFTTNIDLNNGMNEIVVANYKENKLIDTKTIKVYYFDEEL